MNKNGRDILEVSDLKTYFFTGRGVVKAVDGISFRVKEGESLGIVGESGCGKSMTALSLMRMVPQPAGRIVGGEIKLNGENLLEKSEREMRRIRGSKISIILQDPMSSLNPVFTIGSQVGETIRIHQKLKGSKLVAKIKEALRLVRIPAPEVRMRDFPHQLSGGMRQRVTGAIALSCEPLVLIADEPTTSLDVTIQAQYLNLLKEVQQEMNVAFIFISHDFSVVARMCDTVMVMYAGKIVESGGVRELLKNPSHPYTIGLLKCVPRLETKTDTLYSINGQPPSLLDAPEVCRFAPRCPERSESCQEAIPPFVTVGQGHQVSCWRRGNNN